MGASRVSPAEFEQMHKLYNELGNAADGPERKHRPQVHKYERLFCSCSAHDKRIGKESIAERHWGFKFPVPFVLYWRVDSRLLEKPVVFFLVLWYHDVATQSNYGQNLGMCFCFGKNALSTFGILRFCQMIVWQQSELCVFRCVALIGPRAFLLLK